MKESRYNIWVDKQGFAYVFNGVSGALLRIRREERSKLRAFLDGNDDADFSASVLEQMTLGYMLVPDDGDELQFLAERYNASRYDTSRFALTIVTSLGCNFDCPYCFEAKHPSILSQEVEQALLKVVDEKLARVSALSVTWFGGEPLIGKQPLLRLSDAFISRCRAAGASYTADIATNGYLLDEETCKELQDRKITHAQVCLDGPPEVHDRMRPLAGGKGSFWKIVQNLHHAINYFGVTVRMNVDTRNFDRAEELLQILAREGLAGKLSVYVGQIVGIGDNVLAPSASYGASCFTNPGFAKAEREFAAVADRYGFAGNPALPRPTGAPCTAVRSNEMVVGSDGELYKCWDSVGNRHEVIGNIRDYMNTNGRLNKWLKYDPFSDADCRSCIALPVCMGGCAHHAMELLQRENRCGTFRHTYAEQVLAYVEYADQTGSTRPTRPVQLARRMETR